MSRRTPRLRPAAAALLLTGASLLSCGREVTGLGGRGRMAEIQFVPAFETVRLEGNGQPLNIGDVVEFARVRVVLLRTNGDTAVDRTIDFPSTADSVALTLSVQLSDAATSEGEPFAATLRYVTAAGDTVFRAGPVTVLGKPSGGTPPQPPVITARYVGPGANAASLVMTPPDFTGTINQTVAFATVVRDSSNAVLATAPVAFTSSDSLRVGVNLRTGLATLRGARGAALIVGQTLTGQSDTALVTITPTASQLLLVSGGGQQVRQGSPFPQPVRVRVNAVDGLGVAGVPVAFTVTGGAGSTSQPIDTTDANGLAEVTWTAGDAAGAAQLQAAVVGAPALAVVVTGTQLSSAPTALTFEVQPVTIQAGASLPAFSVVVRDATADTVRGFAGTVDLALAGGTVGANLVGGRAVQAVNGVATFSGLTVDRDGANYRLVASIVDGPSAQSNAFTVTPSQPAFLTVVGGIGQSAPPSTVLPDSIAVRVTDIFGFPKAGVAVTWSVVTGAGVASPTAGATDANGRAATQWTLGASGAQQLRASIGGLIEPVNINATIQAGGGSAELFLGLDSTGVSVGRSRPVTVFLTAPAPAPITVDFATRGPEASWAQPQLVIPTGASQLTATLNGLVIGSTWAVVSSSAGTDSMRVVVDTAVVTIDLGSNVQIAVGDTVRTLVVLDEPAPAGGLVVTVVSTDSSRVLVAPGTGLGVLDPFCYYCYGGARADTAGGAVPVPNDGKAPRLLAPLAGTASITVAEGNLTAVLVILPIQPADGQVTPVPLTVQAPGFAGEGASLVPRLNSLQADCYYCTAAPGQAATVYVEMYDELRRDALVRMRSLDPAVVAVRDSLGLILRGSRSPDEYFTVVALAAGSGRVEYTVDGVGVDTATITMLPPLLSAFTNLIGVQVGASNSLYLQLGFDLGGGSFSYGAPVADPLTVTATSRDPAIASLERTRLAIRPDESSAEFRVVGHALGSTWVDLSAPGYPADSVQIVVSAPALDPFGNAQRIGRGLVEQSFYVYLGSYYRTDPTMLSVSSSDEATLRVLTTEVPIAADAGYAYVRLLGRATGFATLTFAAPGFDTVTFPMEVIEPELILATFASPATIDADSASRGLSVYVGADGQAEFTGDTVEVTVRSTDPSVLVVTDSILRIPTGASASFGGNVRAIAPGTARLTVHANGFRSDTSALVTVRPLRLQFAGTTVQVGNGLRAPVGLTRLTPPSAPLIVTFAVSGTGGSTLEQLADTLAAGTPSVSVNILAGPATGTDTVIATAPGLAADTLIVQVVRTRVEFGQPSSIEVGTTSTLGAFLYGPNFTTRATVAERRFTVTSRDTGVVRVTGDTLVFDAGTSFPSVLATLEGRAPGQAMLVMSSVDGSADPDSALVRVVPRYLRTNPELMVIGMRQSTYYGELYVERQGAFDDSLWVQLRSSDPALVSVPDSILMTPGQYYQYYSVAAGDTIGSARITASAPGFVDAEQVVVVTRLEFSVSTYGDVPLGSRQLFDVYATGGDYYARPLSVPIPVTVSVDDPTVAAIERDSLLFEQGEYSLVDNGIVGLAPGRSVLRVSDRRAGVFDALTPGRREFLVRRPRVEFLSQSAAVVPGTATTGLTVARTFAAADSLWARVRSLQGRATTVLDSVLFPALDSYAYLPLEGLSAGVDSLVIESANHDGDTLVVRVMDGVLRAVSPLPATMVSTDSTLLVLQLGSADGQQLTPTGAGIAVSFATSPELEVRVGGAAVTSTTFAPGANSLSVWVVGRQAGLGRLSVTAPGFLSSAFTITLRSPPD